MAPRPADATIWGDLGIRVLAGLVMAAVAALVITLGGWFFVATLGLVVILMAWEWAQLTMATSRRRYAVLGVVLLPLVVLVLAHYAIVAAPSRTAALLGGGIGALVVLASVLLIRRAGGWSERLWAVAGIVYLGVPAVALLAIRDLPSGLGLVFWLVLVVMSTDVAAYLVGRSLGGPKLAPRISPGKTWSGLLGGMAGAALVGGLAAGLAGLGGLQATLLAALLAAIAQSGDLFESAIKRRAGVKDSGRLIPGHGGMLDRMDGYLFASPALALFLAIEALL